MNEPDYEGLRNECAEGESVFRCFRRLGRARFPAHAAFARAYLVGYVNAARHIHSIYRDRPRHRSPSHDYSRG